ncbi:PDZ domain-containing protein [Apilactobacillus apisilvae]|uniref:endopeptidase La n=2 Tax=Apilactobacillus apisilvae TaxID=2923364 RepID=A0ABY4PJA6_9LACO|nr:SepM family pheromone-processing serine protease [Apilactobacillus apisilvae]UQS85718.1 PDZ domain-containing protein [Apilactobacillus apisilvae]
MFTPFLPQYIESPGNVTDIKSIIKINNHEDNNKGSFMLTTVTESKASPASYLYAKLNPHYSIESVEDATNGEDNQTYMKVQNFYMINSINEAIYNAYLHANKKVSLKYNGIYVLNIDNKSKFKDKLSVGDTIIGADGKSFDNSEQFRKYINNKKIGEKVTIKFNHDGEIHESTEPLIKLFGSKVPGIGIILIDNDTVKPSIPIKVNPGAVGGPSGGLMFSLQIYSQLTGKNIRHNQNIAGTGTIDKHGNVGEIGGIDKKIIAAKNAGCKYFLAPYVKPTKETLKFEENHMTNYQLAVKTAKKYASNMKVIPVTNFDDALKQLNKI